MIKNLKMWMVLFFGMVSFSLFAHEDLHIDNPNGEFSLCRKMYIDQDQIVFSEGNIYVNIGEFIVQTSAIQVDECGYFFENVKADRCLPLQIQCRRCTACNFIWDSECYICGKKL